jgi:hypothetical protein
MQAQRTEGKPFGVDTIDSIQRSIIHATVGSDRQRPWAFDEIVREYSDVGDQADVEDALDRLKAVGLIHDTGGNYYTASRAAVQVFELGILGI